MSILQSTIFVFSARPSVCCAVVSVSELFLSLAQSHELVTAVSEIVIGEKNMLGYIGTRRYTPDLE